MSTLLKHKWVEKLHQKFIEVVGERADEVLDPWDAQTLAFFVAFLSHECGYATSSIEDVVIPSLKRIYRERAKRTIPEPIHSALSRALAQIKLTRSRRNQKSKEPVMVADVVNIVRHMSDGKWHKPGEAALFILAVSVGARALTCEGILLGDIKKVTRNSKSGKVLVHLTLNKTKGNHNWNHPVILEGTADEEGEGLNFVYWLKIYMQREFSLDLATFEQKALTAEQKRTPLFPWSKNAMRERLKKRAVEAGYPKNLFAFHSLRAGFICSALMKAHMTAEVRTAIMETTAFIAGWQPGSRAQMRYVKRAAIGTLVASRVVDPTNTDPYVEESLMTPEMFHGITLQPQEPRAKEITETFVKLFAQAVAKSEQTSEERERYVRNAARLAYWRFAEETPIVAHEAFNIAAQHPEWKKEGQKSRILGNAFAKCGRKFIAADLKKHPELAQRYAEQLAGLVGTDTTFKKITRKRNVADRSSSGPRQRKRWSEEETAVVMEKREEGMSWKDIAKLLPGRTNVDCKDRHRNVERAKKSRTAMADGSESRLRGDQW